MKNIISATILCTSLSIISCASSKNQTIISLTQTIKDQTNDILKEEEIKEVVPPPKITTIIGIKGLEKWPLDKENTSPSSKITITINTKWLEKWPLDKKRISPSLASLLWENQVEQIITVHNPKLRKKFPTKQRIIYSQIDSIEIPLIFDGLASVFPKDLQSFIEANPQFKKVWEKINGTGIFVVKIKKSKKYALAYYQGGELKLATHTSPGKQSDSTIWEDGEIISGGIETPEGTYAIWYRETNKISDLFKKAPMPYALHINDGVFIHGGYTDGTPLSHGCIRIPGLYAQQLFGMVPRGTKVVVSFSGVITIPTELARPTDTKNSDECNLQLYSSSYKDIGNFSPMRSFGKQ